MTEQRPNNNQEFASRFPRISAFDQEDAILRLKAIRKTTKWDWQKIWDKLDSIKMGYASADIEGTITENYLQALSELASQVLPIANPQNPNYRSRSQNIR